MHFIILAQDKPDHLDVRMANRPDHLAYAEQQGCVMLAGPLLSDDDEPKPKGSMLIIDVADQKAAEEFAVHDPYAIADLFAEVRIMPWTPAIGMWKP